MQEFQRCFFASRTVFFLLSRAKVGESRKNGWSVENFIIFQTPRATEMLILQA